MSKEGGGGGLVKISLKISFFRKNRWSHFLGSNVLKCVQIDFPDSNVFYFKCAHMHNQKWWHTINFSFENWVKLDEKGLNWVKHKEMNFHFSDDQRWIKMLISRLQRGISTQFQMRSNAPVLIIQIPIYFRKLHSH